jgi:hypothetical protein
VPDFKADGARASRHRPRCATLITRAVRPANQGSTQWRCATRESARVLAPMATFARTGWPSPPDGMPLLTLTRGGSIEPRVWLQTTLSIVAAPRGQNRLKLSPPAQKPVKHYTPLRLLLFFI